MSAPEIKPYEDTERVIGGAILRFAQVEAMIDAIIEMHYTPGAVDHPLLYDMLADEGFSFSLRCNVLRKVLERRGIYDKEAKSHLQRVRELGNLRNVFAHFGRIGIINGKAGALHGKKFDDVINSLDLAELRKQLDQGIATVEPFLLGIMMRISPYQQALRKVAEETAQKEKAEAEASANDEQRPTDPTVEVSES